MAFSQVRRRSQMLADALEHERTYGRAPMRKALAERNGNRLEPSIQPFAKTMSAIRQIQMTPRRTAVAAQVDSPGLHKAMAKGLELQHQHNMDGMSKWNKNMNGMRRAPTPMIKPRPPPSPVRPTSSVALTPMRMSFNAVSARMNGVTSKLCETEGLQCYPLAMQEGMAQMREMLKLSKSGGDGLVTLKDKMDQLTDEIEETMSPVKTGLQVSVQMKSKITALRKRIKDLQAMCSNAIPAVSSAQRIQQDKQMTHARSKVSELLDQLEQEAIGRAF